jgi:SAM-dependent methyltransferase
MSTTELPFDKYEHYTASVQSPRKTVRQLDRFYREARPGGEPRTLREDFCGTFAISCAWVTLGPEHRAVGIDLDPEPLHYGCTNNRSPLKLLDQLRVRVIQSNVLAPGLPNADVIAALNFSYWVFKTRAELLTYFRKCVQALEPGGVMVLDCMGGPDHHGPNQSTREYDEFTYFFEQESWDPVTHEAIFQIHFERTGEQKRLRVFTYDWRMWTVPELREALLDAGFASVRTYWSGLTPKGDFDRNWHVATQVGRDEYWSQWINYVVGLR